MPATGESGGLLLQIAVMGRVYAPKPDTGDDQSERGECGAPHQGLEQGLGSQPVCLVPAAGGGKYLYLFQPGVCVFPNKF